MSDFRTVASTLDRFFRSHDLDPTIYQIHITTFSPIALDQLRLALSSDYKHLWVQDHRNKFIGPLGQQPWPRNHFVGRFQASGVNFRTSLEPKRPDVYPQAVIP